MSPAGNTEGTRHGWEGDRSQHPSLSYPQAAFRLLSSTRGSLPTPAPRTPHGDCSPLRPQAPSPHSGLLPHVPTPHMGPQLHSCPQSHFTPHASPSLVQPQTPGPPRRPWAMSPAVPPVPTRPKPALTARIPNRPASAASGPAPASYWPLPPRPSAGTTTPSVPRARAPADNQSGAWPLPVLPYTGAGAGLAVTSARGAPHCGGEAVARGGRQGALRGPDRPQSRPVRGTGARAGIGVWFSPKTSSAGRKKRCWWFLQLVCHGVTG